jgi:hypothetical protein
MTDAAHRHQETGGDPATTGPDCRTGHAGRSREPAAGRHPLRATSGNLTASELITEAGLRRDVVYRDHKDLVENYHARVRAQTFVPDRIREITAERDQLKARLVETAEQVRQERHSTSTLRRLVTELSLELQQAHERQTTSAAITRLPRSSSTSAPSRPGRVHPAG